MAHLKNLLSGIFDFVIKQSRLPKGTIDPVTFTETATIPDFDGRPYSPEEVTLTM